MINRIALIILVSTAFAALFMSAEHFLMSSNNLSIEEQVKFLEKDIDNLNQQLKQERVAAFNAQMDAQELLQVEWEAYSKKIQEVEDREDTIESLERRIKDLTDKKQKLTLPQK